MTGDESPQLQIDAQVIRQLGDQLVTDAEQALIELIKNCWDADASTVNVIVDTHYRDEETPNAPPGRVLVEDDGAGMSRASILQGWLTISLSPKRDMKLRGHRTERYRRTPLGDKGLGRLGTMKLGNVLHINTHSAKTKPGYHVSLAWSDFQSGRLLSTVPVTLREVASTGAVGTTIEVRGLTDPAYWRGERRLRALQTKLSTLVSPFEEFSTFKLSIVVDGKPVPLERATQKLREAAVAQFACTWDDESLACVARCKLSLFAPQAGKKDTSFEKWVEPDSGKTLFRFLAELPSAKGFQLRKATKGSWYVEVSREWSWEELAERKPGAATYGKPGPFTSELDAFTLDPSADWSHGFSNRQTYRAFVKEQSGVRVYRDGFGIRMAEDWLGLGQSWTSGASYYGLKPSNTIGYVAISASDNPLLEEKSDREGFIDSPSVRGFYELTQAFAKFANDALTSLRRGYNEFREQRFAEEVQLPPKWEPPDAVERLKQISRAAKEKRKLVKKSTDARTAALDSVQTRISRVLSAPNLPDKSKVQLSEALTSLREVVKQYDAAKTELDEAVDQIADEEKLANAILERFGQLQGQMNAVYDVVAVGLVAQALAHDVHALIEDLLQRTQRIGKRVRSSGDPHLAGYLEAVRATANAVRKQLTFLDPMLRAARETRQVVSLEKFTSEFFELRRERLSRLGIDVRVSVRDDFEINFNTGRLLQVFDNLCRNSEYWLRQYGATHPKADMAINVEIDVPCVTVWDTGPGIKPAYEQTLFDIFVTDKPRSEGSGLGLFIVKQILVGEGCNVRLAPERNGGHRLFQFIVDFSGARRA